MRIMVDVLAEAQSYGQSVTIIWSDGEREVRRMTDEECKALFDRLKSGADF